MRVFRPNINFLYNTHYSHYRLAGAYSLELFAIFTFYELDL